MGEDSKPSPLPWYKEGLNFQCTECGKCCTGGPGAVWVAPEEIATLADRVGLSEKSFLKQYTRKIGKRISLTEKPNSYDCIFLRGKKCSVYDARPKQCRTFPWWPANLASPEAWREVECEGINPDAKLIPLKEIEKCLNS